MHGNGEKITHPRECGSARKAGGHLFLTYVLDVDNLRFSKQHKAGRQGWIQTIFSDLSQIKGGGSEVPTNLVPAVQVRDVSRRPKEFLMTDTRLALFDVILIEYAYGGGRARSVSFLYGKID